MKVYFSDFFQVSPQKIEKHGAFNISLINDLPLFIDPFLLFNSKKRKYQALHKEILRYVTFLRNRSVAGDITPGLLTNWYRFPEVKQNWLGYSLVGNSGRGPGLEFAKALDTNLRGVFADFDKQHISSSPHLEKLCLIKENIGRDNISDFTTNLIKGYLLEYTQEFAQKHISGDKLKQFTIRHTQFNYTTSSWESAQYTLPCFNNDFVLLTPKDLLTKEDTWINKPDIINDFHEIVESIPNRELRDQLSFYFTQNLPKPKTNKNGKEKAPTAKDIATAVFSVIQKYPQFLDFYIKFKEETGEKAQSISGARVQEVYNLFVAQLSQFIDTLSKSTSFYSAKGDTLAESFARVGYLKNVIENKDGYKIFYIDGKPVKRESDLQIMFKLTWCASESDVSPETNAGRGAVDFKISRGASDKTLVEFKLASNSKLAQNLENQVEIYKKAHDTDKAIKVILFFSAEEEAKVKKTLKELRLDTEKNVVLIDARNDNKLSASRAK